MRGKDDDRTFRNLIQLLDEYRALRFQGCNNRQIVDDGPADVNGSSMPLERVHDGVNGAADARAKAARRSEKNLQGWKAGACGRRQNRRGALEVQH
jgi:hypothetical protein